MDWYPWSNEAFERARRENKPIFLSIGYSTCHWCHVMARESFEDAEVAALLNKTFVCIKVDREERPDLDHIYMSVCQLMTGTGGWPLTMILTPDKKPFFAATYIPKHSRYGKQGLIELIPEIECAWHSKQDTIRQTTNQVQIALQHIGHHETDRSLSKSHIDAFFQTLHAAYDATYGGFGSAPKFPTPHILMSLLRYWHVHGEADALSMVEHSLSSIGMGGIHDHVGSGFHRYSVDAQWHVPHFEKMLYDQALLMIAYAESFSSTQRDVYREEVLDITTYVQNALRAPEGGFFSAEDADSEGVEGKYYTWSYDEIRSILKRDAPAFCKIFGIRPKGNITNEATHEPTGLNVLHRIADDNTTTPDNAKSRDARASMIRRSLKKLRRAQRERVPPAKDDKILTDWNGLMIAALAIAGRSIDHPPCITMARRAVRFITRTMMTEGRRLFHRYRKKQTGLHANLDDYAFLAWGVLECYRTTFNTGYLEQAIELCDIMIADFWDPSAGGFFFQPVNGEHVLLRQKIQFEGALPSGNAVAYHTLRGLDALTGTERYARYVNQLERTSAVVVEKNPTACSFLLGAYMRTYARSALVTIVGKKNDPATGAMIHALHERFLPYTSVRLYTADSPDADLERIMPGILTHVMIKNTATAYVCTHGTCYPPTTDIATMLDHLEVDVA